MSINKRIVDCEGKTLDLSSVEYIDTICSNYINGSKTKHSFKIGLKSTSILVISVDNCEMKTKEEYEAEVKRFSLVRQNLIEKWRMYLLGEI